MIFKQLIIAIGFLLFTSNTSAQVPNTLNYQGRLTDASGTPVADGAYLVKFIIYDAPTAGTDLWNTGFQTINTVDGLFSYQLGSNVVLPNGIFSDTSRYLGLTVGTDAELTPRSRFISSAFAFEAGNVAWSNISSVPAGFADGVDNEGLSKLGDTLKGNLYFDGNNDGTNDGMIQVSGNGSNLVLNDNGFTKSFIWGNSFGEVDLYDVDGSMTAKLEAGTNGGRLALSDTTGSVNINLSGNLTGNSSVILPQDAISSNEILDEPGIAQGSTSSDISLPNSTTSFKDIITTTITIPAPGYIFLIAKCYVYHSETVNSSYAFIQISEDMGGSIEPPNYMIVGNNEYFSTNTYRFPTTPTRTYYKASGGTYTFRLEGMKNSSVGFTHVGQSSITAIYIPTSYGTVSTVSTQPPTDAEATQVSMTNPDGSTTTGYNYDLRDIELKVKKAELELLKAQHERDALLLENQRNHNNKTNR